MQTLCNVPKYIKLDIFNQLCIQDLLNIRLVNKLLNVFIKNNNFSVLIKPKVDNVLNILNIFGSLSFDLSGTTNITNETIKLLVNCYTLNLTGTSITDESVKFLGNCHTLNLS